MAASIYVGITTEHLTRLEIGAQMGRALTQQADDYESLLCAWQQDNLTFKNLAERAKLIGKYRLAISELPFEVARPNPEVEITEIPQFVQRYGIGSHILRLYAKMLIEPPDNFIDVPARDAPMQSGGLAGSRRPRYVANASFLHLTALDTTRIIQQHSR